MRKALIELALKTLRCNQKELAAKLNVSPTQITKWKQGEYMSVDMETKIRSMIHLGEMDPDFVLMAGGIEASIKWDRLIHFLAGIADFNTETGYVTYPLLDELGLLCYSTLYTLNNMGVSIPSTFPSDLEFNYEEADDVAIERILENPYAGLIYDIFISLNNVYGFYSAYVQDLLDNDDLDLYGTPADNIEPCMMDLAAAKMEVDIKIAPQFYKFKQSIMEDYLNWLTIVKEKAIQVGVPLRVEILDLLYRSNYELCNSAEAESLGFNSHRLHPDIYMNELLIGMRTIHQVLPFIMKKMGIYEEFQLDASNFNISGS